MHWPSLFLGLLLGWLLEWCVDYLYWRRREQVAAWTEARLRSELASAQSEIGRLRKPAAEVDRLWLDLSAAQMRVRELEAQLADALDKNKRCEAEIRALKVPGTTPANGGGITEFPRTRAATGGQDDLQVIEGIGPVVAKLLHENGIRTFQALSRASIPTLRTILETAGPHFRLNDPRSWPEQARLAAVGDWNSLNSLQAGLRGSRARAA